MNIKYLRVSTQKQDLRRQEEALKDIKADKIYKDKTSGASKDRPALNELRLNIKDGDHIYFESISRLGRSVLDIKELIEEFHNKNITLHFVKEGITTNGKDKNSMANFLLNILSSVAELEREITRERILEGMEKAKIYGTKSGKPLGRPPIKLPKDFERIYKLYKSDTIIGKDAIALLNITRPTFFKWLNHFEKQYPDKIMAKKCPPKKHG